jgi:hypothetical protein
MVAGHPHQSQYANAKRYDGSNHGSELTKRTERNGDK